MGGNIKDYAADGVLRRDREIRPQKLATVTDLDAVLQAQRTTDPTAEVVAASPFGSLRKKLEEKIADLVGLYPCCDHFLGGADRDIAQHWRIGSTET